MAKVQLQGVRKVYDNGQVAVKDASFEVADGELMVLVGPSGCGKSTLLRMVAGLEEISGGTLTIGDRVVKDVAPKDRDIAMVFQSYALYPHMTVAENLAFPLSVRGMNKTDSSERVKRALSMVQLDKFRNRYPGQLSGGQQQRVALARALALDPDILFLDEPTAGLDPQSRLALWEVLRELHDNGQTILLTTHYMEEADQLCDRIAIMDKGRILALDDAAGLKASVVADTIVTVSAEGELERLAAHLAEAVPGATEASHRGDGTIQLGVAGAQGVLPAVLAAAEQAGFEVTDLSVTEPTLETVFIKLTGK